MTPREIKKKSENNRKGTFGILPGRNLGKNSGGIPIEIPVVTHEKKSSRNSCKNASEKVHEEMSDQLLKE